ncbi:MAG: PilZ domain-containing protein [Deltaproteobacteria bacterium]|nr:PilZ domain-containing protein [Deltaproteobacteria bacterium]
MSEDPANKRQTPRVDTSNANLSAHLFIGQDKNAVECIVSIRDFSRGGASLYVSFKAPAATPVRLSLEGVVKGWLEGVVAWCMPIQGGDGDVPPGCTHRMGIDFRPKDKAGQAILAAAFEHISQLADEVDEHDDEG